MANESLLAGIRANDLHTVSSLLEQGAALDEADEHGWTPLCWAAGAGNAELVRGLIERGADVFHTGRDKRTPYLIALAAGHVEAARVLSDAESDLDAGPADQSSRLSDLRPYCTAYPVAELRKFPGWPASVEALSSIEPDGDDAVVFLHRDLTVTGCIWPGVDVVFDEVTHEWRDFCDRVLGFRPPTDLEIAESSMREEGG